MSELYSVIGPLTGAPAVVVTIPAIVPPRDREMSWGSVFSSTSISSWLAAKSLALTMSVTSPPGTPSSTNEPSSFVLAYEFSRPCGHALATRKLIHASGTPAPVPAANTRPRTVKPRNSGMTISRVFLPAASWSSPRSNCR
jgi:hypothetical protein